MIDQGGGGEQGCPFKLTLHDLAQHDARHEAPGDTHPAEHVFNFHGDVHIITTSSPTTAPERSRVKSSVTPACARTWACCGLGAVAAHCLWALYHALCMLPLDPSERYVKSCLTTLFGPHLAECCRQRRGRSAPWLATSPRTHKLWLRTSFGNAVTYWAL